MVLKSKDETIINIDGSPSDAIAPSVRYDCPIYAYDFILQEASSEESEKKLIPDERLTCSLQPCRIRGITKRYTCQKNLYKAPQASGI